MDKAAPLPPTSLSHRDLVRWAHEERAARKNAARCAQRRDVPLLRSTVRTGRSSYPSYRHDSRLIGVCGNVGLYNHSKLPYRWLPGLEVHPLRVGTHLCPQPGVPIKRDRLEVMRVSDWWNGPLWMYAAPGSGNWWDPGRSVCVANLLSALLLLMPLQQVVAHLESPSTRAHPAYSQWWTAYSYLGSWDRVVLEGADGNGSSSLFAMAGILLADLLKQHPKIDSIILYKQMHFWPRWDVKEDGFAPSLIHPCSTAEAREQRRRVHYAAEIIDFRVMKKGSQNANKEMLQRFITADKAGTRPCSIALSSRQCLSCSNPLHAMCKCATLPPRPFGQIASPMFDMRGAWRCCQQEISLSNMGQRKAEDFTHKKLNTTERWQL
mmetsp:Transcript_57288/g.94711  ORF Transcript_57288/g.94711 Transcript_57288/m.94711 type:complete len:379 (+) Transcript_57288:90-1226(+)|eukprot:CAMPEP_0119340956 /NCGR_PEP_ID=MMETSP1333-20130426/101356_1 /TAXON_ID=418940 /ORGANISM="Scyphosphaera apsteinii, Strain RCC1455" /LENGTH=378 /DNA_ID=CAMNT_0007352825 /DNA_START=90 /DNA_END=1226 /DNA_ORIENTATION=+